MIVTSGHKTNASSSQMFPIKHLLTVKIMLDQNIMENTFLVTWPCQPLPPNWILISVNRNNSSFLHLIY